MRRTGFTMIELIFVIVILGILSAVAVPKMMNTSSQAKASNCRSYYSTLNNSVGASLWSNMAIDGLAATDVFTEANINDQIKIPEQCGDVADVAKLAQDGTSFTTTVEGTTYDINGTAATSSAAPFWDFNKH